MTYKLAATTKSKLGKKSVLGGLSKTFIHNYCPISCSSQLSGRLFSPSDISKKLPHHFLLHFPNGMGSYDHHIKYQGVFPGLLYNSFLIRFPPLNSFKIFFIQRGDPYEKEFYRSPGNTLMFCVVIIGTHTNWKMQ